MPGKALDTAPATAHRGRVLQGLRVRIEAPVTIGPALASSGIGRPRSPPIQVLRRGRTCPSARSSSRSSRFRRALPIPVASGRMPGSLVSR